MDRVQLVDALKAGGVPEMSYDIEDARDCPWCDSCVYLRSAPGGWEVGFRERGLREPYRTYSDEDDAVADMLRLVLSWGHLAPERTDPADG